MRKTGRSIDLKPKNGITFDKSKIECFNCQKLGHFARECRFAKYQENKANGRNEKRIVAIEDSNSKALVATDNNEDIDWTKEFDAEPNEYAWGDKYEQMEYDLKIRDLKLEEKQKELDQVLKERDDFKVKLEKWSNASVLQNEVLNKQRYVSDKSCIGFGIESSNRIDELAIRNKGYLAARSREFFSELPQAVLSDCTDGSIIQGWIVEDLESQDTHDLHRGNPEEDLKDYAIIDSGCSGSGRISGKGTIKTSCLDFEKVSYVEELKFNLLSVSQICDKKHNVLFTDKECLILSPKFKFVDEDLVILRAPRKNDVYSLDLKNIIPSGGITCLVAKATEDEAVCTMAKEDWGHVNFKKIQQLVKAIVESIKQEIVCLVVTDDCSKFAGCFILAYKDETSDMLHDFSNTACYVLNRVLVTKPQMKTPYEILMGRSPNISFMRPFGCSLTILNTLDHLGKFDGKSEEENQKGKGPDWMFDLDLLTPSMNYIPVRKENYADSKEQGITCDDAEELDDQQFIVHTTQPIPPEESTAAKEVKLSSEDQALHDELVSLMHQESLAKAHNDDQRMLLRGKEWRISIAKGKEHVDSTFTLSTANTPPQSTGNTPTDSDDDTPTGGVFSTNSFDAEEGGVADYNNLDPSIDVPSTPTLRIHKIHPQSQIIGKICWDIFLLGFNKQKKASRQFIQSTSSIAIFIYKKIEQPQRSANMLVCCLFFMRNPRKVLKALADESWVEAMQEELTSIQATSGLGVM
ncbi:ribonuclease H-like domain-containing protein [Tanacetum coccineum]